MSLATARVKITTRAIVNSACACGRPYSEHVPQGVACSGYTPVRAPRDLGLRSYEHPDRLCMLWWRLERFIQGRREQRERFFQERRK